MPPFAPHPPRRKSRKRFKKRKLFDSLDLDPQEGGAGGYGSAGADYLSSGYGSAGGWDLLCVCAGVCVCVCVCVCGGVVW